MSRWEEIIGAEEEWMHDPAGKYIDDVTGFKLDEKEVYKARKKELDEYAKREVWTTYPRSTAFDDKRWGRAPLHARWVYINNCDDQNMKYRSRLVACEYNTDKKGEERWYCPRHLWKCSGCL